MDIQEKTKMCEAKAAAKLSTEAACVSADAVKNAAKCEMNVAKEKGKDLMDAAKEKGGDIMDKVRKVASDALENSADALHGLAGKLK